MMRRRISKNKRADIYKSLNGRCAYCGQLIVYDNMHVEHVQPLSKNGADCEENMLPSCNDCDTIKADRGLEEFRNMLQGMVNDVFKNRLEYVVAEKFGLIKTTSHPVKFYFETKNIKLDERKMINDGNKDFIY